MELGALIPLGDFGGAPAVVRDYAQAVEAMGYDFLEAPDHVLGVNAASRHDWDMSRNTSADLFHDPFVLFGFVAGCTSKLGFSTGVLILSQRQTVLVAKQAACLDVLCDGRFRLGIGVGWNEVEFVGLNENFRNRGRRSEEQVQVMQALWAQDHVAFKGKYHTIDDAGINPRPASGRVPELLEDSRTRGRFAALSGRTSRRSHLSAVLPLAKAPLGGFGACRTSAESSSYAASACRTDTARAGCPSSATVRPWAWS